MLKYVVRVETIDGEEITVMGVGDSDRPFDAEFEYEPFEEIPVQDIAEEDGVPDTRALHLEVRRLEKLAEDRARMYNSQLKRAQGLRAELDRMKKDENT